MSRKALIIAYPGEEGPNYCKGVIVDESHYQAFLLSPEGGLWQESEITVLRQPTTSMVISAVNAQTYVNYSLTVFCGHGFHSATSNSTTVLLNAKTDFDSQGLRRGAPKHTLILDCCRVVEHPRMMLSDMIVRKRARASVIHPDACRRIYDEEIALCSPGIVVMYGCSVNQTAGDSESDGGYYSSSLLEGAEDWSRKITVDTTKYAQSLSVVQAHDLAVPLVGGLSGGRQTPTIEKPRSTRHFPFCVIA